MAVSLSCELVRLLDRLNDLVVAGATAKIAHHPVLDLVLGVSGALHDLPKIDELIVLYLAIVIVINCIEELHS